MEPTKVVEALPASSILLIRDEEGELEVLMTERAKTMKFAPGAFVFPGGKIDKSDGDLLTWQALTNSDGGDADFAYRVGALRELYEEASVLLTDTFSGEGAIGEIQSVLNQGDYRLDTASLVPFAHWVTPETMPRRFNTYFYLAAHNGQTAKHDGDEAVSLRWVSPTKILQDWDGDQVPLMFPTRLNLIKLARANSVAEALEQARNSEIVMTMPSVTRDDTGIHVTIPEAAGYGVTEATAKELRVETPK